MNYFLVYILIGLLFFIRVVAVKNIEDLAGELSKKSGMSKTAAVWLGALFIMFFWPISLMRKTIEALTSS